jgi:hypothetical protein
MTTPIAKPFEEWRPIPNALGYEASNLGRVRSWRKPGRARERMRRSPILRKAVPDRDGYLNVGLSIGGVLMMRKVHHLVLEAFVGLKPEGKEARHRDSNPGNNERSNLSWSTHRVNEADKVLYAKDFIVDEVLAPRSINADGKGRGKLVDLMIR